MTSFLEFLSDPIVWYTLAVVVFLGLLVRYGGRPILAFLDGEIAKVRAELDAAQRLRQEAETELAAARKSQAEALADAEAIVAHAKEEAARLRAQAETDLKKTLANQEQRALERIHLAEVEARESVRTAVLDMALEAARKILAEKQDPIGTERLVTQALADIPRLAEGRRA